MAAFNPHVLTQDLKRDGGPVRFLLMVDDDLVVALARDELAVLEPRGQEGDAALGLVGAVVLKKDLNFGLKFTSDGGRSYKKVASLLSS